MVELHGGTVHAQSAGEGTGATFTVFLPLLKNKGSTMEDSNNFPVLDPQALPLTGMRILVIDDDADTRELTALILEQVGATVTTAVSGLEALQIITHAELDVPKFDVLVSDIGMPDIDGYMLIQQIRKCNAHKIIR